MKLSAPKRVILLICLFLLLIIGGYFVNTAYVHYYHSSPHHASYRADLSDLFDDTLSHYYVHTDGTGALALESGMYANPPFNFDGVPVVDYGEDVGRQENPVTIAQYGLDNWELYLQTQDGKYIDVLLIQSDWLVDHQENGKWAYNFEIHERSLQKGWISAMAQGQAISLLLRAWQFTEDSSYFQSAQESLSLFKLDLKENGVSFYESDSSIWFEEYPDPFNPTHVLNGHIWALFGLWDYYRVTHDSVARQLFDAGIQAVEDQIDCYDTGYWVLYEQKPLRLVSGSYMDLQIDQMVVLYALTQHEVFDVYAKKWYGYFNNKKNFPKIVIQKIKSFLTH
ncbi:hypothetical protein JW824_12265 [bacterium]|nr:hypothetical protein [bacterium]RQV92056.1 MAG: hypothetical protein EH221_12280 [bacterium]